MEIGYAALTEGLAHRGLKKPKLASLDRDSFQASIDNNLGALENMLAYNIKNQIGLFRLSSDLIPFASRPDLPYDWKGYAGDRLKSIGREIRAQGIRVSMHPGQYSILNSPKEEVVENSLRDLDYHCDLLDLLGLDRTSKLILHVGGVYGDKEASRARFIKNYRKLDPRIKERLVIENDHRSYNVEDIISISSQLDLPLVYDNLHHAINPPREDRGELYYIDRMARSWKKGHGRQKIHYSQQAPGGRPGSHSRTIDLDIFKDFHQSLGERDLDIMLEVKDKNLSTIKVKNLVEGGSISSLEEDWARYKYSVLEKSPGNYNRIRQVLKDKKGYPVLEFYRLVDQALEEDLVPSRAINSLDHVWGYFKNISSQEEKDQYQRYLRLYKKSVYGLGPVKRFLEGLAQKYGMDYLLASYYFYI